MYYNAKYRADEFLCKRMREIAEVSVRYGFWRNFILLRREGFYDNHKRVYKLYKLEQLNLRIKRPRRSKAGAHRTDMIEIDRPNRCWSMDFVAVQLFNNVRFRALTVIDNFTRKCLSIFVGQSIKGEQEVNVMESIKCHALPERIQVDNGSEFISKALDKWAYENRVILDYSRQGKPRDNPFIESFNGAFRDECLNTNWFLSLEDADQKIQTWKTEYNSFRLHSSLDDKPPDEFEL